MDDKDGAPPGTCMSTHHKLLILVLYKHLTAPDLTAGIAKYYADICDQLETGRAPAEMQKAAATRLRKEEKIHKLRNEECVFFLAPFLISSLFLEGIRVPINPPTSPSPSCLKYVAVQSQCMT